jgi:hypothetical protein
MLLLLPYYAQTREENPLDNLAEIPSLHCEAIPEIHRIFTDGFV